MDNRNETPSRKPGNKPKGKRSASTEFSVEKKSIDSPKSRGDRTSGARGDWKSKGPRSDSRGGDRDRGGSSEWKPRGPRSDSRGSDSRGGDRGGSSEWKPRGPRSDSRGSDSRGGDSRGGDRGGDRGRGGSSEWKPRGPRSDSRGDSRGRSDYSRPQGGQRSGGDSHGDGWRAKKPEPAIYYPAEKDLFGEQPTWLYGLHAAKEAMKNPLRKCLKVLTSLKLEEEIREVLISADKADVTVQSTTTESIEAELPKGAVHQNLAVLVEPLEYLTIEDLVVDVTDIEKCCVMLLDGITDPHNIGAIVRSAVAFGVHAIVVPEHGSPTFTSVTAKTACGGMEYLPVVKVTNLKQATSALADAGFWSTCLSEHADKTLSDCDLKGKQMLILGSEGKGVKPSIQEGSDVVAKLPTQSPMESLNVSNAAAITLYEFQRQNS